MVIAGLSSLALLTAGAVAIPSGSGRLAKESPAQILNASKEAVGHVRFVEEVEQIGQGPNSSVIDYFLATRRGYRMTVSMRGRGGCQAIYLIHGRAFMNCDASFLLSEHVPDARKLAGKWLRVPGDPPTWIGPGSASTSLEELVSTYLPNGGILKEGREVTIDGKRAIPLSYKDGNTRLFIAATGQPYPLALTPINASIFPIRYRFTAFNVPFVLKPPARWLACSAVKRNLRCTT